MINERTLCKSLILSQFKSGCPLPNKLPMNLKRARCYAGNEYADGDLEAEGNVDQKKDDAYFAFVGGCLLFSVF
jgi:hypothetical protein